MLRAGDLFSLGKRTGGDTRIPEGTRYTNTLYRAADHIVTVAPFQRLKTYNPILRNGFLHF
jgi:hypothetical protein